MPNELDMSGQQTKTAIFPPDRVYSDIPIEVACLHMKDTGLGPLVRQQNQSSSTSEAMHSKLSNTGGSSVCSQYSSSMHPHLCLPKHVHGLCCTLGWFASHAIGGDACPSVPTVSLVADVLGLAL